MKTKLPGTEARAAFRTAPRLNRSLTASTEKRVLAWMAARAPEWVTSDQMTVLSLVAQLCAALSYAWARHQPYALLLVSVCLVLNWFGDSMDGTLARERHRERPRYGFYVDHKVAVFGYVALKCGLGCSGFLHWQTAIAMLIAFLLLASESYLATYTLSCFQTSQGIFGPTELRLLLILGNVALLHSRYAILLGRRFLLFDLGGTLATLGMFGMALLTTARHTAELYSAEPLPPAEQS